MHWHYAFIVSPDQAVDDAAGQALEAHAAVLADRDQEWTGEMEEQRVHALAAAKALIGDGPIAHPERAYRVDLTGSWPCPELGCDHVPKTPAGEPKKERCGHAYALTVIVSQLPPEALQ